MPDAAAACVAEDCCMRVGAVVRRVDKPAQRGVVQFAHGVGTPHRAPLPLYANDAVVRTSPGQTTTTNIHRAWEPVPAEEMTTWERVQHAWATYELPDYDGEVMETDSLVFKVMAAFLTPPEFDRTFGDGDWPCSLWELAEVVARAVDERLHDARIAGAAMARLEGHRTPPAGLEHAPDPDSTVHGDGPCQNCGAPDIITWFTDSVFWNWVVRDHPKSPYFGADAILCIPCFVKLAEFVGVRPTAWRVTPEWPWRRAPDEATMTERSP